MEEEESSDTNRSDDNAANSASPRPEEEAEANADSEIFCRICQVRFYFSFAIWPVHIMYVCIRYLAE